MDLLVNWTKFWSLPLARHYLRGYHYGFRRIQRTHGNRLYRDAYAEGLRDRQLMEEFYAKPGLPASQSQRQDVAEA